MEEKNNKPRKDFKSKGKFGGKKFGEKKFGGKKFGEKNRRSLSVIRSQ